MSLLVLKFGGTSVADVERIRNVAAHVKREVDSGHACAVVVSAMVLSLDATDLWVRLQELLACSSTSVREELKSYAAEKGVQI